MSLGSTLQLGLRLDNITKTIPGAGREKGWDVKGVRMMCEIQGPGGRYRLGEVIHGKKQSKQEVEKGNGTEEEKEKGKTEGEEAVSDEEVEKTLDTEGEQDETEPSPPPKEPSYEELPNLKAGEAIALEVKNEMKELGSQIIICSVAWETNEGRRTFQRFYKFNVSLSLLHLQGCESRSGAQSLIPDGVHTEKRR